MRKISNKKINSKKKKKEKKTAAFKCPGTSDRFPEHIFQKPGMVECACNPNAKEVETGRITVTRNCWSASPGFSHDQLVMVPRQKRDLASKKKKKKKKQKKKNPKTKNQKNIHTHKKKNKAEGVLRLSSDL
jgi:hypothetical protein